MLWVILPNYEVLYSLVDHDISVYVHSGGDKSENDISNCIPGVVKV